MDFDLLRELQDGLTSTVVPGNDIAVSVDGRDVYRRQSGYADRENGIRMRGDELYFLWSGTKLFTTSLAMRLWEEKCLSLDAPVAEYLPEFEALTVRTADGVAPAKEKLTVRHLFTMTSGLDYDLSVPTFADMRKKTDGKCPTREIMHMIAEMPLCFEPGTHFRYGMSHDVLGAVVETVTGKRLRDYAREVLFGPLGMSDTFYGQPNEEQKERMAAQYFVQNGVKSVLSKKTCFYIFGEEYDSGGAGAVTSCDDYMKFAKTLARGGTSASGYKYLARETIDEWRRDALTPTQFADFRRDWGEGYSYGLGVKTVIDHAEYGAADCCFDFGWGGAAGMRVYIAPDENIAAVYMMHLHNMPDIRGFEKRLRNTVFACVTE